MGIVKRLHNEVSSYEKEVATNETKSKFKYIYI